MVLPACAGVILVAFGIAFSEVSFTRMRGGDPESTLAFVVKDEFYPHARG